MLSKGSTESLSTIKPNLVQSCSCLVLFTLLIVFESFLSITSNKRTTSPPRCTVPSLKFCFDVYSLFTNIKANRKKLNRFHWYWVALSPRQMLLTFMNFKKLIGMWFRIECCSEYQAIHEGMKYHCNEHSRT